MTELDIIQNLIFQLGQSQNDRLPNELDIHFADVDERSAQDLWQFAGQLAKFVNYYRHQTTTPTGDWTAFFPANRPAISQLWEGDRANVTPHLALFLAFLELYKQPQAILNQITGRHLDFYYKQVLQLTQKPAIADKAHILVELKKNTGAIALTPTHLFSAGKDQTGVELLYAPTAETVVNHAKVESLRSLYVSPQGTVHYAPIANSVDGVGGALPESSRHWCGFGNDQLPLAEVGFAIASPVLRMQEGTRQVTLTLTLDRVDTAKINSVTLQEAFEVFITGEKSWIGPTIVSPKLTGGNTLTIEFAVPASEKAVVDYNAAIHGYAYTAQAPIVQVFLRGDNARLHYGDLQEIRLLRSRVNVSVTGITALHLENDDGRLDPTKAFLPFGPQPTIAARFKVGYSEALSKKLSEISLRVMWKDIPATGFAAHYEHYTASKINHSDFTATVTFKDGGSWSHTSYQQQLFAANPAAEQVFTFTKAGTTPLTIAASSLVVYALSHINSDWAVNTVSQFLLKRPVWQAFTTIAPEPVPDFLTFSLEKDFLHSTYRKKYVEYLMAHSQDPQNNPLIVLNEPYTPAIQRIFLSYTAYSDEVNLATNSVNDFAHPDVQFFHIAYFGQMQEHAYQRHQFEFVTDKSVTLLPRYAYAGELLIGCSNLQAGDSVSILFQVAEGSADPEAERQPIQWFVLCDNYWRSLQQEVVQDTTHDLLTSGIIQLIIPPEATTTHTVLPHGLWIKAAVPHNVEAVSQLVEVAANAIEVQFQDRNNDPAHLTMPLEPQKIAKLKAGSAAVKAIQQPYASFGGQAIETDSAFSTRVSERLRHKQRCISAWDYERMILAAFPDIHQVKCIPHAKINSWLAPGHVLLVVIPNLRNRNAIDPLQPKVDANTISQIAEYVQSHAGMQVKLHVKNPSYQPIQIHCNVQFRPGYEFNYYREVLQQDLIQFLSPWLYDTQRTLTFGGKIYKSVVLDFVEDCHYVDYLTDFKLYSYRAGSLPSSDLNEVQPATPDAILVSAPHHTIHPIA
ncbi:baseplate J/gp47 family protein [Pantanalinema sp. GBBB05]|uniref:baseplate J/gp47 family protein n=1 Tax=Pantanalinema sp. GBBB05 TaxID=2604139 RepID=UPI001D54CC2A|nr:hypothetical protein [Pantanalinema sp. GBBB05]